VRVHLEQGVPVARIEGEIDIGNDQDVAIALGAAAPREAPALVVDLTDVTYLDSRAIYRLLELAANLERRRQSLRVVVAENAPIRKVLLLSGLTVTVPVFATVMEALHPVRTGWPTGPS
jgi:anti-anti-sigma factor